MAYPSRYQQKTAMLTGKACGVIDTGQNAIARKANEIDPVRGVIDAGKGEKFGNPIGTLPDFRGM